MTVGKEEAVSNGKFSHTMGKKSISAQVPLDEEMKLTKHNLPLPLTSFVGREQDVAEAEALLQRSEVRLLTLTGVGGVGKTRLGIQVAIDLLPIFSDGVCFVPLASLDHPDLVISAIAQTIGLREIWGHTLFDLLVRFLHEKHLLLVLDNFEHLLDAAPSLVNLLQVCPGLKLLVTSRTVLRVQGEQQFLVHPLCVSASRDTNALPMIISSPAVQLFIERIQALRPDFRVTTTNTSIIADICACVDGLPLAIELAASHGKIFPPSVLLKRLTHHLMLLVNDAQDVPVRQQTLRKTLDWSYNLLEAPVARLFLHLSVFVGGCSLEAIEAVEAACNDSSLPVFQGITSLIDNSLVQQVNSEADEPHLLMLETVRAYGLERLQESGELGFVRCAHAHYYLTWAEQAEAALKSKEQVVWLERLEREHDNLRLALRWLGQHEKEGALRLICALTWFWIMRGYLSEGRQWLEQTLRDRGGEEISQQVIVKAFANLGEIAFYQNDLHKVMEVMTESSTLLGNVSDDRLLCLASIGQAYMCRMQGDYLNARTTYEQTLALARQIHANPWDIAGLLWFLADIYSAQGEYQQASAAGQEGLALMQEVGDSWSSVFHLNLLAYIALAQNELGTAKDFAEEGLRLSTLLHNRCGTAYLHSLRVLGRIALLQGNDADAGSFLGEALSIARTLKDQVSIASLLCDLGQVALNCGDEHKAHLCYEESMALACTLHDKRLLAETVEGLGAILARQKKQVKAAILFGAASMIREHLDSVQSSLWYPSHAAVIAETQVQLGEQVFAAAWERGHTMTPEQALNAKSEKSSSEQSQQPSSKPVRKTPDMLTGREIEVLRLLAQGLTSAQIAEQLVIGVVTVNFHVRSIYSKLGVNSRATATRYALEHGLA